MGFDGDTKRLGHKRRHTGRRPFRKIDYGHLFQAGSSLDDALKQTVDGWGRRLDRSDPACQKTVGELATVWKRWPVQERWMFLEVVQAVALSMRAKFPVQRQAIKSQYRVLMNLGIDAFSEASAILRHMRPLRANTPLGGLVTTLASFGLGCYFATGMPAKWWRDPVARAALDVFLPVSEGRLELLARVATLACGTTVTTRTIRRYRELGSVKSSGQSQWKKHMDLIEGLSAHTDATLVESFRVAGMEFLQAHVEQVIQS